jgi:sugar phosphate isomerase/epimerase
MTRRDALRLLAASPGALTAASNLTQFQLACMTLPYAAFPLTRALEGIRKAGFDYVAWGTTHENTPGRREPVMAKDAPASEAKKLADRCRSIGLKPVMMFSEIYVAHPDSVKVHTRRIEQAAAAGIPIVLTFGEVKPGAEDVWVTNLKQLGPIARRNNVLLTIKQHGGNTATGKDCLRIVRAVNDPGVKMTYDAGNVLDYNNDDPIADIQTCWQEIRAFCIKDHRNWPKDEDCGPGLGEIDHYKLLAPVMHTGLTMPLAFENIFEPLVPRPKDPAAVDTGARRSREFIETVLAGLRSVGQQP